MKYKLMLLGLILLITTMSVMAIDVQAPIINITMLSQDPDPVGPGEYFEVRFKIHNDYGGSVAERFQVMLDPDYPFSLDKNEEALRNIGEMPALGDAGNVLVLKFKVRVAENAVEGANPLKLKYKHGSLGWISREFDVDVQTVDANLGIVGVETLPEKIKPGEEVTLNIKVKNMADSTMKDVTLKLDLTYSELLDSATVVTASDSILAFNSLPFAPIGSATEQKIESLNPGEEYIYSYKLIAFSDAESMIYKVPIEITYYDELETSYVKNDIIGLVVGSKPDMSVVVEEADLYVGKTSGDIAIKFVNKGFSDVKFLQVTLEDNGEYEVISAKEVYIGNVESDDYETAEFTVFLTNGATKQEKTIHLPINVEYRDANNNIYTEKLDLELDILKPEKLGIKKSSNGSGLIIILLVVGGIIYYRRRKKKKK